MFRKTMKFEDLNGDDAVETFYFNYSKKEIAELLEFGRVLDFPQEPGFVYEPLETVLKTLSTPMEESGLSNTENNRMAYLRFQTLILDAYGKKGDDNVTFEKSVEIRNRFKNHVAFVELIFEFLGNEKLAAEFIEKCLPPKLVEAAKKENAAKPAGTQYTPDQITEMVDEAARRQEDPATRIEPGYEAAVEAGVAPPIEPASPKKPEELTELDITTMSKEEFDKIDVRRLKPDVLHAAFRRKAS